MKNLEIDIEKPVVPTSGKAFPRMTVSLVAHTPLPEETVYRAAVVCYAKDFLPPDVPAEKEKMKKLLRHLAESGHTSTFEHASFTFAISGVSRVATNQLVRHRIASYSQQSQRYVNSGRLRVVVPPSIEKNPDLYVEFLETERVCMELYTDMVSKGIPEEDARYILPHGMESKIAVTMNARELRAFFEKRLCRRAQEEIRVMASRMFALVRDAAPMLFEGAGPGCATSGCVEKSPCGRPWSKGEKRFEE